MKNFTRENNGYTLTIQVNEEELLKRIQECRDPKYEYYSEDGDQDYNMNRVNSYEEYCSKEEILADLDEFEANINYYIQHGNELFDFMRLKKNGTFTKNAKPILKEAINGAYWEDSYGWNTMVLRIEPINDTLAELVLTEIVIHY